MDLELGAVGRDEHFIDRINSLYVIWLRGLSVVAFVEPRTMLWFDQRWIFWSLAVSMLGMGLSLTPDDFRAVARMPGCVALGFCLQYTVMACTVSIEVGMQNGGMAAAIARWQDIALEGFGVRDGPHRGARMLDYGEDWVRVPHVDRVVQAELFVRAASYPPLGQRGVSRTVRDHDYGLRPLNGRPAPLLIAQQA